MTGKRMNWERLNRRDRVRADYSTPKQKIPVTADESFWQHWHHDRAEMIAAGYRVAKTGDRWHAWIEK
jgi:hypothetical protein